jgi:hypothetical protein
MKEHGVDCGKNDIHPESDNSEENRPAAIMIIAPILGAILWIFFIYMIF